MNPTSTEVSPLAPSDRLFARPPESAPRPWGALLLLLMSYGLVLLAPIAFQTLRLAAASVGQPVLVAEWVPVALAIGLALLGGAAMVTVLKRLVSELERKPYAGVAAAFGVLMGSALIALRAPFHLGALDSGACAVLCLLVSITGAALALQARVSSVIAGGVVALSPAPLLVAFFWGSADHAQTLQGMLYGLPPANRTFLGLVALFGLLLWLVAVSSRNVQADDPGLPRARKSVGRSHEPDLSELEVDLAIPLTRHKHAAKVEDFALAPTVISPRSAPSPTPIVMPPTLASEPSTRLSVWSFHDAPPSPEDFEFPELPRNWGRRFLWSAIIVTGALAAAAYFWRFSS